MCAYIDGLQHKGTIVVYRCNIIFGMQV